MASRKVQFVQKMQEVSTLLAQAKNTSASLLATYWDRGYDGGGDTITDADLVNFDGVHKTNIESFITLAEQFIKFLDGDTVTTGDYDSVINVLRNDL